MRRTILVVEDNPDDAELTAAVLRQQRTDAVIDVVADGLDALDYLGGRGSHEGRGPATPALILLDLKMPRMGGLELLRRLRADERTRRLPVVVLTSSMEETDRRTSYDLGANGYVRKPVDFDQFVEVARKLGDYWLDVNEPPPGDAAR
jgi:two-component system, response regulator